MINNTGQETVDFESLAQAVADLQDDAQLVGRLGLQAAPVIDRLFDGEGGLIVQESIGNAAYSDAIVVAEANAPR